MKMQRHTPLIKSIPLTALILGLFIGLISMALVVSVASAAPRNQTDGTPTPEPKDCFTCHPDVNDAWMISPHARAFDEPAFNERWKSLGEPGECLLCHTSGYQATTGKYNAKGVTCEACHGETVEGHPPALVDIRSDADYCGACHPITLGEWRLTGHAAAGVGCTDCHNPHNQNTLFEDPNELCLNCHKGDLGEHQKDLHIEKGIGCIECHALVIPPQTQPVDGLKPTGHSFTTTAVTCVACHTDTLHIGHPLPGYEAGAKAVSASEPVSPTLPGLVAQYTGDGQEAGLPHEQQIQALQAALASTRLSTLFQGGIVGLVLGGSTVYFVARNQRRAEDEVTEQETTEDEQASGAEK